LYILPRWPSWLSVFDPALGSEKKIHEIQDLDDIQVKEADMRKLTTSWAIIGVIAALIIMPFATTVQAQDYFETREPGGGAMMYDTIVVRPIGIVATAVGSVFWLVSWPFSALSDSTDMATKKLIKEPAAYTFRRPLGEF
jgi:hypothetical protein